MNYLRQRPVISSILINLVLFGIVLIFSFPVFNSGDDAYLMYLLAGGFGEPPTDLLHYNYGMHPYIGLLLKNAFTYFPNFNWYSFFLYAMHFLASCVILRRLIAKNNLVTGPRFYLLFFMMECFFLLQPNFSNTALVMAIAGTLLLYTGLFSESKKSIVLYGYALLIFAALLRLHMLAPPLILASPFLLAAFIKKRSRHFLFSGGIAAAIILLLVFLQQQYYKQHIPSWEKEEAYRQAIIDHYNRPKKEISDLPASIRTHAQLLEKGILWDTAFLSRKQIIATTAAVKLKSASSQHDFRARLFWLLIESRLGILLVSIMFAWKFPSLYKPEKRAILASVIMFIVLCASLILFRKLPGYIVIGGLLQLIAFTAFSGDKNERNPPPVQWLLIGASAVLLAWGIIKLNKINRTNKQRYEFWQCAYTQASSHKNKLLLVSDDRFPLDYFHVWDVPQQFPLTNLLTKDHFLNNTYRAAYNRYGITSPFHSSNVLFSGALSITDVEYLQAASHKQLNLLPMQEKDCIQLWELH